MIQINIPNARLAEFTDHLIGRPLGLNTTEYRGTAWYPVNSIDVDGDQLVLHLTGEKWDPTLMDWADHHVTIRRPLDGHTAAYLPERLADFILTQLTHPTPVGA